MRRDKPETQTTARELDRQKNLFKMYVWPKRIQNNFSYSWQDLVCGCCSLDARRQILLVGAALLSTGWWICIGCLKLQFIFYKRSTNCRALLRKVTYEDKASYISSPLCICLRSPINICTFMLCVFIPTGKSTCTRSPLCRVEYKPVLH